MENLLVLSGKSGIMCPDDANFLVENKNHFGKVVEHTYIWRTNVQKESILSDEFFPTVHSKFHQGILEQKVQFEQTMLLVKEYELKKIELDEYVIQLSEQDPEPRDDKLELDRRRTRVNKEYCEYELGQMSNTMVYRMKELRGWKVILDRLFSDLLNQGMSEDDIWNKEYDEVKSFLFLMLNRLQGVRVTKDSAELSNLVGLAKSGVVMAKEIGKYDSWKLQMSNVQIDSIKILDSIK